MTAKEMRLAAYFLDWFCNERGNAGCNDMPKEALEASGFNSIEARKFSEECAEYVDREPYTLGFMGVQDDTAIALLALKLRTEADFKP